MKKQLLQTAVITAILSGVNGIVSAGGGQDADVMPVYTLDDVIVTAQRVETKELDTPASTTVITREEIAQSGAKSAADVLSKVNGFTYKSMGQGGASLGTMVNELNIRGVDGDALVLVNGNPIAWRGKYNLDAIAADNIERIEIVKGSGSVLYGSTAVSGVVNIITKKGGENSVTVGAGNFGQRAYGVSVGDERFGLSYNMNRWGEITRRSTTEVSGKEVRPSRTTLTGAYYTDIDKVKKETVAFNYRISPVWDVMYNYYNTESRYKRYMDEISYTRYGIRLGEPYNMRKYDTSQHTIQAHFHAHNWNIGLYFNTTDINADGPTFIGSDGKHTPSGAKSSKNWYQSRERNRTYGVDAQKQWRIGDKANLIAGLSLEREIYKSIPSLSEPKALDYTRNNWGLFAQWTQKFDDRNTGVFGARETWTTGAQLGRNYNNFSMSGQFLHKLNRDSSVYMNVTQSFKMPAFSQMFNKTDMAIPNPGLKPQTGVNYEIGWKMDRGAHSLRAALFHIRIKDNITPRVTGGAGNRTYVYINEDYRNTGIELSDKIAGKNGFSYHWGLTWQNPVSRQNTGKTYWDRKFGKIQLTGGISYERGKWTSDLSASYLGSRVQTPSGAHSTPVRPYLLTSWNTIYRPDAHSEISLAIDNLLDREDVLSHSSASYWATPANYMLNYTYRF
ncbi:TonB-dependent siderophore receptor [uncultured Selenomonas sp.]|uniref:TonB-dependent receptor plug domain-containing protein n=1 Tax=uncultured Selenomonas sp. TaxID=159275 RepID=UPI001CB1BF73|nr:TonB-dependent receptor [uncultured Selenomonas sp.]MBF1682014.1 TonB-dependent receptor [Selenomonas artemidis]